MIIYELNRLNMIMNDLVISTNDASTYRFLALKEKIEDTIAEHQEKYKELTEKYSIQIDDEQNLTSDDNDKVHEILLGLVSFDYPIATNLFTQEELLGMIDDELPGGHLSFLQRNLVK